MPKYNFTLLHKAAKGDKIKICEYLREDKADIEALDLYGYTPLSIAVESKSLQVTDFLIKEGANMDVNVNKFSKNQLMTKILQDDMVDIFEIFIQNEYDVKKLQDIKADASSRIIEVLLKHSVDPNTLINSKSLIFHAVKSGKIEIVKELINKSADVNARDSYRRTPLFYTKSVEITTYIYSKGADINATDMQGNTPIMRELGIDLMRFYVENGANINKLNNDGN